MKRQIYRGYLGTSAGALALAMLMPSPAFAQAAPDARAPAPAAPAVTTSADATDSNASDIVVTGFRQSLNAALNVKRESVAAVDAIVAEDIAKFPDQNLAESLQRIPGVAITREGGEGKQISVRGLGGQFTAVRLNGLQAQAASFNAGSGGGANRDRSFDFNIFASELFKSIVVHKTYEPSLDEGSLGAVVDLNTGHPLGAGSGLTGVVSAQGSYNDLSKKVGPRVAGLINWVNPDSTFGANFSIAYQHTNTLELGNNTTRWAQAAFGSVDGTPCFAGSTYVRSPACDKAALAFHPRIPRYGIITHDRERLGLTGSIEWQPTDATHIELDGLFSRYKETRQEYWAEVLFRSNEKGIALLNPVYDSNNNLIAGTFNNAYNRNEHYKQFQNDMFYQFDGKLDQNITDNFRVSAIVGASKSDQDVPLATTLMLDNRSAQNFHYDYSNMAFPVITFGTDPTNPANYQLAEIRDAPNDTVNLYKTAELNTEWDVTDEFKLKLGGVLRQFDFRTTGGNRNTLVCPKNGQPDVVLGTFTCSATQYGFPVNAGLVDLVNLGNAGQPAGTTTSWIVADLPAGTAFTKLYSRPLVPDVSNIRSVTEKDAGFYLQFDQKGQLFGVDYALNGGVRYVETRQGSTGLVSGKTVTIHRTYHDWLPAVNFNLFPTKNITLRFAASKVMTRPSLGNLTPGGSVDPFNFKVNYGNPFLDPYRATDYDAAFEWYFAPQSLLSVAVFRKDVKSFPVATVTQGTFASTGLPTSILSPGSPAAQNPEAQPWTISSIGNGKGAKLDGLELGLQAPFSFLPGILSNFGAILNTTFIKSTANYQVSGPATTFIATGVGPLVASTVTAPLFGLSKRTYNATLFYEKGPLSARVSYSYRGPYIDQNSGTGNIFEGFGSYSTVDASVRYSITKNIELSVDATNLTDTYIYHYTDLAAQRNYESAHFGRTIVFGGRFKF